MVDWVFRRQESESTILASAHVQIILLVVFRVVSVNVAMVWESCHQ